MTRSNYAHAQKQRTEKLHLCTEEKMYWVDSEAKLPDFFFNAIFRRICTHLYRQWVDNSEQKRRKGIARGAEQKNEQVVCACIRVMCVHVCVCVNVSLKLYRMDLAKWFLGDVNIPSQPWLLPVTTKWWATGMGERWSLYEDGSNCSSLPPCAHICIWLPQFLT